MQKFGKKQHRSERRLILTAEEGKFANFGSKIPKQKFF